MSTERFTHALQVTHSFDPNMSPKERLEAERYLMELREHPDGLNVSFHIINNEPVNEVRCFWAFNTIMHHLPTLAGVADDVQADQLYQNLFGFIYRYFFSSPSTVLADYLANKHAQVMVVGLQEFFPARWGDFFTALFNLLERSTAQPLSADAVTVYFLRVFEYIDERVVSVRGRADRSRDQRARDMAVKDAMRESVIPLVVQTWYGILCECRQRTPEIAKLCLSVVQTYIEWIDVSLFMTADWINLLYFFITAPSLRTDAAACLLSLVEKKQLPGIKMNSLRTLCVADSLPRIVAMLEVPAQTEEDIAFIDVVAKLVVAVAEQFLSLLETCSTMLQNGVTSNMMDGAASAGPSSADGLIIQDRPFVVTAELIESLAAALHAVVTQLFRLFSIDSYEVREELLPFIQMYVKTAALTDAEAAELVLIIFQQTRIRGLEHDPERIWNDATIDQRKLLHNLLRLLYRRFPQLILQHLQVLVERAVNPASERAVPGMGDAREDFTAPDVVEAVLRYLYEIGEAVKLDCLRDTSEYFTQLILHVLHSEAIVHNTNSCVNLAYFEVMDRYYLFFTYHKDFVTVLLQRLLLLPCGVVNANDRVRSRICYLFGHLIQVLKSALRPHAAEMVTALQSIVSDMPPLLSSDRRDLYEAIGVLLTLVATSAEGSDGGEVHHPDAMRTSSATPAETAAGEGAHESSFALVHAVARAAVSRLTQVAQGGYVEANAGERVADAISYLYALAKGIRGGGAPGTEGLGVAASSSSGGGGRHAGSTPSVPSSPSGEGLAPALSPFAAYVAQLFLSVTTQVMEVIAAWHEAAAVRERGGQYFHQMINIVPYELLGPCYEQYVQDCLVWMEHVPELSKLLRLMYQFINRTGARGLDTVTRLAPLVWAKIGAVGELSAASPVVLHGVVSESARERLDVYKQLFIYIFTIASGGCGPALLMVAPDQLQTVMRQLLYAVTLPADLELPKSALQTLGKVVLECCGARDTTTAAGIAAPAQNTSFMEAYVLEEVIPTALRVVSDPSFDLRDAKNFLVVGEVGQLCVTVVSRLGDPALHVIYGILCPMVGPEEAMGFCMAIRDAPRFSVTLKVQLRNLLTRCQAYRQQQQLSPAANAECA